MTRSVRHVGVLMIVLTTAACRFGFEATADGADATVLEIAPPRAVDGSRLQAC